MGGMNMNMGGPGMGGQGTHMGMGQGMGGQGMGGMGEPRLGGGPSGIGAGLGQGKLGHDTSSRILFEIPLYVPSNPLFYLLTLSSTFYLSLSLSLTPSFSRLCRHGGWSGGYESDPLDKPPHGGYGYWTLPHQQLHGTR